MATKPVIGNDYTDLTSFELGHNGLPTLSSKFQCKVLDVSVSSFSNGGPTATWAGFDTWPRPGDTTEIELAYYLDTHMLWLFNNDFDGYTGKLDAGKGVDFFYVIDDERIAIGGDDSWITPSALQLSMTGAAWTFSRYYRNDFNVAYSLATEMKRDIFVGHAFMDCRAKNLIIEEIFTILKQHPELQRWSNKQ